MYSAFGVDHGDISKRLPSALRGKVKGNKALADRINSGTATYADNRIIAHASGKAASKFRAQSARINAGNFKATGSKYRAESRAQLKG